MPRNAPVKSTSSVKIHNAIKIDSKNPTGISYGGSSFTTINGLQYIPFFSHDDNLFRSVVEARLLSPTHNNCINDKVFYSVGDGLQVLDQEFPKEFDKKINPKRQTIDDILKTVFGSHYLSGNKFIEIACTEVGNKRYVHVYPHNSMHCRLEAKEDGSDPTHVLRSRLFINDGIFNFSEKDMPIRIPLWNGGLIESKDGWIKKDEAWRTMIHIKNEFEGIDFYGLSDSYPGFHNIVMEYLAGRFNMDNFENNMFLAGVLFIQGNMSDTEEKKFLQNLKKMYTGAGKGQRILPVSSEAGLTDTKFVPFSEQKEGHFIEFDKHNEDKIIGANSWSRTLLDMQESSSLGKGGEFLKQLFQRKFRTVISPAQQIVLNNFIFPLMQIHDEWKSTKFYDLPWIIKPVIPVSLEGILDINSLLTVDEGREELGKKPLGGEQGKKMISEVGAKPKEEKKPKGGTA